MKSPLLRRSVFLLPLACAALYGCPPAETTETNPDDEEYADVIYGGAATDEALIALGSALDKAAPAEDPARAPVLDSPTEAELPASPIPTFTWHHGAKASFRAPPREAPAAALLRLATTTPSFTRPLAELLGPPRAAHAHGDPVNGTATFLTFSTKTDAKLVRVFTTNTTLTLGQEAWDKIAKAGEAVTLSLIAADFDNNRIADGGAPVQGTKYTFTVTP